jgi:hypothetical protein
MLTITPVVSTAPASQQIEQAPNDTRHELIRSIDMLGLFNPD